MKRKHLFRMYLTFIFTCLSSLLFFKPEATLASYRPTPPYGSPPPVPGSYGSPPPLLGKYGSLPEKTHNRREPKSLFLNQLPSKFVSTHQRRARVLLSTTGGALHIEDDKPGIHARTKSTWETWEILPINPHTKKFNDKYNIRATHPDSRYLATRRCKDVHLQKHPFAWRILYEPHDALTLSPGGCSIRLFVTAHNNSNSTTTLALQSTRGVWNIRLAKEDHQKRTTK